MTNFRLTPDFHVITLASKQARFGHDAAPGLDLQRAAEIADGGRDRVDIGVDGDWFCSPLLGDADTAAEIDARTFSPPRGAAASDRPDFPKAAL